MELLLCINYECIDIVYKILRYANSVSRLCLHLRDVVLELNLPFDMCKMASRRRGRRGRRGRPRGFSQAPPVLDQQAFVGAVGIAATAIAQARAAGS